MSLWLDRVLVNPRDGAWHFGAMLIGREPFELDESPAPLARLGGQGLLLRVHDLDPAAGFRGVVDARFRFDRRQSGGHVDLADRAAVRDRRADRAWSATCVTLKPLDAQIRSANPYLGGWLAALMCYPPFILMGDGGPLDYHAAPATGRCGLQGHPALLWAWGGCWSC